MAARRGTYMQTVYDNFGCLVSVPGSPTAPALVSNHVSRRHAVPGPETAGSLVHAFIHCRPGTHQLFGLEVWRLGAWLHLGQQCEGHLSVSGLRSGD